MKLSDLLRAGASAAVLLVLMIAASLVLWLGIPVAWLWVASQVQSSTDSPGAAFGAALGGVVVSVALLLPMLSWLSNRHRALRRSRGLEDLGHLVLEMVLVMSAGVAVTVFVAWFLLFSGSAPIPIALARSAAVVARPRATTYHEVSRRLPAPRWAPTPTPAPGARLPPPAGGQGTYSPGTR